jgi:NAD-dependent dihydropyrimidine dehydrogenase PreA subunit
MYLITVDKEQCTGCEICLNVCPVNVFEIIEGQVEPINGIDCNGCKSCMEVCESEAIDITEL